MLRALKSSTHAADPATRQMAARAWEEYASSAIANSHQSHAALTPQLSTQPRNFLFHAREPPVVARHAIVALDLACEQLRQLLLSAL